MAKNIVTGQKVLPKVHEAAKELRSRQTPQEKILWECHRGNRLDGFHFRRQQIIGNFIVDFYCHQAGLVIELDGAVHDQPDQQEYDQERDANLLQRGFQVLRIHNSEIDQNLAEVLERIRKICRT